MRIPRNSAPKVGNCSCHLSSDPAPQRVECPYEDDTDKKKEDYHEKGIGKWSAALGHHPIKVDSSESAQRGLFVEH